MPKRSDRAAARPKILLADDDPVNCRLLARLLGEGADVTFVHDGGAALERAVADRPDLILLDVNMPVLDGYETCRRLKALPGLDALPVIFITGLNDSDAETAAFSAGAVDFVTKPFHPDVVRARVNTHLELKFLHDDLESQVRERTRQLEETQREILQRLAMAAEYRDPDTGTHINRIGSFVHLLCSSLGMERSVCDEVALASTLHDLGKIAIPDGILLKPTRLTDEEFTIMKRHPSIGGQLLEGLEPSLFEVARQIAMTHHEKWDGSGYPAGLSGEAIPLVGRMVALCDVYDALTSERPYKGAWTSEEAFDEIARGRGLHFDPALTDLFLSLKAEILRIQADHGDGPVRPEGRGTG